MRYYCFLLLALATPWQEPWGKDSDLVHCTAVEASAKSPSLLATCGDLMIVFHQKVISPADGPRSHFRPSSSQYTRDAIQKYGFFSGVAMGCDRLMRENSDPWVYPTIVENGESFKWDPVR